MPPKKVQLPPKAVAAQQAKAKAAAAATTKKPAAATPASTLTEEAKKSLITKQTSPVIVKKAFQKIVKLLQALSDEMDLPLPAKVFKTAKLLDRQGFETLAKRLSHVVTRYVLFVCQEGTLTTIESQSQHLLNIIREVCVALRALLNTAGSTWQEVLVETGCNILDELVQLLQDLAKQVDIEWKRCLDAKGNFISPLNTADAEHQIVQLTARIWKACEKLGNIPLSDVDAIIMRLKASSVTIGDAIVELKQIKEGDYDLPTEAPTFIEEITSNLPKLDVANDTTTIATDNNNKAVAAVETPEDVENKSPENGNDNEKNEKQQQIDNQDEFGDVNEQILSKIEFQWVKNGKELLDYTNSLINTFVNKILPQMQHPNTVAGTAQVDLKVPGALAKKKAFAQGLEQRLADIEMITEFVDMMSENLYSPQNIPIASKYAWCIVSKLSRLLLWCDQCYADGWLNAVVNETATSALFLLEKDYPATSNNNFDKYNFSSKQIDNFYINYGEWYKDPLINPQLRPIVIGTDENPSIKTLKPTSPQYKRLHEFDGLQLPLVSQWFWVNFQRKMLFELIYAKNKTKLINPTLNNNVITVTQIDEEEDTTTVVSYPITNLILQYFLFAQYQFVVPSDDNDEATKLEIQNNLQQPYNFAEEDLYDDLADLGDDDDGDFDDEDDEDGGIYFFD